MRMGKNTTDRFILSCIEGYEIPFITQPPQALSWAKEVEFPPEEEWSIQIEIEKLLAMGAIVACEPVEGQFLSPSF